MADNSLEKVVTITYDENGNFIGGCFDSLINTSYQTLSNIMKNNKTWNLPLDNLVDATRCLQFSVLTEFNSSLPNLENGNGLFYRSQLETFNSSLPKLKNGFDMFCYASNLKSFNVDLPSLIDGSDMFYFKPGLDSSLEIFNSSLPKLSVAYNMFLNCKLPASEINKILSTLPIVTGNHTITFTGCPGASTCDQTIGANKGWTVQV